MASLKRLLYIYMWSKRLGKNQLTEASVYNVLACWVLELNIASI